MKRFSNSYGLKTKFTLPFILAFVFFCQLQGQQIVLPNLKQSANIFISYDATTHKYGLQTLDKKTQLLPNEYNHFSDEGYRYSRFIRISKNGYTGLYDVLNTKIVIEPTYSSIEMKSLPVPRSTYNYFKDNKYYFLTIKEVEGKKSMGLHDGLTEVLPCDYENIHLINSENTDSVLIFAARKSGGSLQLFDYTHRRFLTQTFSHIEPEMNYKGQHRYKVTANGKRGIVDADLNWIINANYLDIMIYNQYNHFKYPEDEEFIYVLKVTDSTYTFTNYKNPKITGTQAQYTEVRNYDKYISVYKGKKLGLVNLDHKQILPCEYGDLSPFENSSNLWIAYANKHYGIVNLNNEKICAFAYTNIHEIKAPYALLYKDETFTIINTKTRKIDGRIFKPSGYTNYDHSQYILSATLNNKVVLLDSNLVVRKTLIDPPMKEEFAVESDMTNSGGYETVQGDDFAVPPDAPPMDADGDSYLKNSKIKSRYTVINANNLKGLMDNELGKEVIKPVYKKIITKEAVSKRGIINFVGYQKDKEFGVIDLKTGNTIFSDEMSALYIKRHDNSAPGLIYFELEYKIEATLKKALADTTGVLTKPKYDHISSFFNSSNWLALVYTENNIRYTDVYDLKNKKYILQKTQQIRNLNTNSKQKYFDVTKDDLHGIINEEGQTLLPLQYKNLNFDPTNRSTRPSDRFGIITTTNDKYAAALIDKRGKLNLTDVYDTIHPGVYDYVITKNKNKYSVVNVRTGETSLANKQTIKIIMPGANKRSYFIYVIDKGKHSVHDSAFKLLTENTDSIVYTGNNTFSHRQKTGFKLYNATTNKFGFYNYSNLSFINDKELFAVRNDSVLTLNHDEKILKVWDTRNSLHELTTDTYQSKDVLITDFIKCLASPDTKALMTWSQKVAQDLTLYHYFESKKVNDKIVQKTGCVFKSPDTQKNADALFAVYSKLYSALREAYGKEFDIEYLSSGFIDDKSITYLRNRISDTDVAYNKPVIFFKIQNTIYQFEMGYIFNELNKLVVYPNEGVTSK